MFANARAADRHELIDRRHDSPPRNVSMIEPTSPAPRTRIASLSSLKCSSSSRNDREIVAVQRVHRRIESLERGRDELPGHAFGIGFAGGVDVGDDDVSRARKGAGELVASARVRVTRWG